MEEKDSQKVFIVHGHDETAKFAVARFVERLDLDVVILDEQSSESLTIIEKFEKHAGSADFAIVLITPDDVGASIERKSDLKLRARQNVIFELGYFFHALGRGGVCALYKEGVELPSDIYGVVYVLMDEFDAWQLTLAREVKAPKPEGLGLCFVAVRVFEKTSYICSTEGPKAALKMFIAAFTSLSW